MCARGAAPPKQGAVLFCSVFGNSHHAHLAFPNTEKIGQSSLILNASEPLDQGAEFGKGQVTLK